MRRATSPTQERIWREVFGDEYPEGVDRTAMSPGASSTGSPARSHVGRARRSSTSAAAGVAPASGWRSATGADLIGIDIAEAALSPPANGPSGWAGRRTYMRGEFEATGLDDASVDAVMSVDALLFTPSKQAAFVEFRRILRPGGRLVLTSWDYHSQPVGRPPQVPDHRPLAEAAGFDILAYDTTDRWRDSTSGRARACWTPQMSSLRRAANRSRRPGASSR